MKFEFKISNELKKILDKSKIEEISIGCSDSTVFRITSDNGIYFLKITKNGLLTNEYKKLKWLSTKTIVPKIILHEVIDDKEFLLTESLEGEMVCSNFYLQNPSLGIPIIIDAFDELKKVDIIDCPFNVSLDYKLNLVKYNLDNNLINIDEIDVSIKNKYKTLQGIYDYLIKNRFDEELCFSHGDISLPNIFAKNGSFSGFIDVGDCGIADKWFDIAIATRTIIRNYGEEYLKDFYKGINIIPDKFKINYYLLMMELYL
ncbi:MAG: aminoglycoside 3'-phosphotransferase [bacterium]|nr:aminoglycoside 3'-phosphotransferase [bacterium]